MYHMDDDKIYIEKARWELQNNAQSYIEQILVATIHKISAPFSKTIQIR